MTFITACVPTNCENGVTMIGQPNSARTRPHSSSAASNSSGRRISASWRRIVVTIPPGIWWR